ncbi:MAG: outer-membrane lipoprotein carrier protein LolA [Magnetovibrio sp.]|nr:outer-membrane lipoprotein carrier protein LolA [Magnetovibrio sp.]
MKNSFVHAAFFAAALGFISPVVAQSTTSPLVTFDELSAALKPRPNERVMFNEERHVRYLKTPVQVTGWVRFTPPERFERQITHPLSENFVIEGDQVVITNEHGKTNTLTLAQHPALQALALGIRATLLGDLKTLKSAFEVTVSGTLDAWTIKLVPMNSKAQQKLQRLMFKGVQGRFTTMSIIESETDKILTTFKASQR